MPKRLKNPSRDPNVAAHALVARLAAGEPSSDETPIPKPPKGLSAYMKALGQRGGKVSGARRMTNLNATQRQAIAKKAATARWDKTKRAKKR